MSSDQIVRTCLSFVIALSFAACRKAAAPELQTTTGTQPRQDPTVVMGCLKTGYAAGSTFVLTSAQPAAGAATTYQLVASPNVDLEKHVGEIVKVSGTVRAQERVESRSGATAEKPGSKENGTPVVETKTDLEVKQLTVDAIAGTSGRCEAN